MFPRGKRSPTAAAARASRNEGVESNDDVARVYRSEETVAPTRRPRRIWLGGRKGRAGAGHRGRFACGTGRVCSGASRRSPPVKSGRCDTAQQLRQ
jgi:hypothetical protein